MTVYPRVGGGNDAPLYRGDSLQGLSPRGRGKQYASASVVTPRRSIPAWAGETTRQATAQSYQMVYPRVGGGNLDPDCDYAEWVRSIPAWAGETRRGGAAVKRREVYPRVGGGNPAAQMWQAVARGLSPRGRGKRGQPRLECPRGRSIPAWAGETAAGRHRRRR